MNILRRCLCFFAALIMVNFSVFALDVSAESAVLYDCLTKKVYYEKNADIRRGMASTTKIMTAVTALENGKLDDIAAVKREHTLIEGSKMYVQEGEKITLEELLYGLMLPSGNDAAAVIADHIAGSSEKFAALMNETAREMGLTDTSFENPSGLDGENHYTTAKELAKIADYAMQNETFRKIVGTKSILTPNGRTLVNHNKLLRFYPYADGVKTGFTKKCGRCLVSSAVKDGRRLIAVTMNAPDDWNDHIKMLDYGFARFSEKKLVNYGETVASVYVAGTGEIPLAADDSFSFFLSDDEVSRLKKTVIADKILYPPIAAGDPAGTLILMIDNAEIARIPLAFVENVAAPEIKKSFFENIFRFLNKIK